MKPVATHLRHYHDHGKTINVRSLTAIGQMTYLMPTIGHIFTCFEGNPK